ncbi:unnamed protein product [Spirodela intermedia]|uniref:Uncharacterized protein n=1 Tax=Spirodela intermedia TaxID=51605 RepID=A0A7I8IZ96_SPIIN|nr:unnamed protein product [Spirodela intermedia]CAA6663032.1 unnamed protein product [Spirodela intermedia]
MATLLQRLEAAGYRDGVDLFGAPYDFRRLLQDLKGLIERGSAAAGGKPAVVVAHSMGNLFVLRLLARSSPSWRRRFVKHFISIAAPWGGAVAEMYTAATGDVSAGLQPVRLQVGSFESNSWLLPSSKAFGSRPLVVTTRRSYTSADMPEFLSAAGFPDAAKTYGSRVLPLVEKLPPPGVPVTFVSGTGVATPELLVYGDGFAQFPEIVYGDGDGTVNMESLLAAAVEWSGLPEQPLKVVKIANATHVSVLIAEETWREITEQVAAVEVPSKRGKTAEDSEQLSSLSF